MRHLYCRKCGYDLTPLFHGRVVEAPCPECGSIAEKRRSNLKSNFWWLEPGVISVAIGILPVTAMIVLESTTRRSQDYLPWLLALSAPVFAIVTGAFLYPKDVPGKADYGRRWPFLLIVLATSVLVTSGAIVAWSLAIAIVRRL